MRIAADTAARAAAASLALLLGGCMHARGTAERPAVTGFRIVGAKALDPDAIREKLATQPSDRFFWQEERHFDEDAFASDRRRVERFYRAEGFYSARVLDAQAIPDGSGRVKLRMRVDEGQPAKVVELLVAGLEGAPEAREKLRKLPLKVGDRFTEAAFDSTRAAIAEALATSGYAHAAVEQRAEVNPRTAEVRVEYVVEPGRRYRFGNVFVSGAAVVPRARVREEAEQVFKPGEWFDANGLEEVQGRIFDLGVFGGVRVSQGAPDEARGIIPVVVAVREAPFRTIRAGPGVGVGTARWDANAVAGWTHRNWLGGLRKLSFDARAGYAWLPNPFATLESGIAGLVSGELTQPGIFRQYVDANLRLEAERGIESGYSYWSERLRIGTPIRLGRHVSIFPSYNLELYQLTGVASVAVGETGRNELLQSCRGETCVLSYLEQRITLDLRDDPINTRRGIYLSFAVQEGFRVFGNGFPYVRLLPEARAFMPLFRARAVVAGRLRIGALRSLGTLDPPVVARFYSGGPSLMRGYYTRQLSPVVATADRGFVPVGGAGLVDGGVELRVGLTGSIGGAVFLDFGNVAQQEKEAFDPGNLQYAAGLGLRYKTPFGPARLDVAGRLPRRAGHVRSGWELPSVPVLADVDGDRKLEQVGRHTEPIIAVQVSIGEAF